MGFYYFGCNLNFNNRKENIIALLQDVIYFIKNILKLEILLKIYI
jgi:hypothetical protein